ncbi:MAG TPA: hypothetical protein VN883_14780 [Myxococcales bacterium]|nr:hypothetical protein [Myxococcales bacterium]
MRGLTVASAVGLLSAVALVLPGCATGGAARQRDERLFAELRWQEQWAGEAVAGRASAAELKRAQEGDRDAQADLHKRFQKLVRAASRATWLREATPAALEQAADAEKPALVASFDRAVQLRKDAWNAADEIGEALAEAPGPAAISVGDLRRALGTVRAAGAAEAWIAKLPPQASPAPAKAAASASPAPAPRLVPAPLPVPTPFIEATALLIDAHPSEEERLRSFQPELAQEEGKIRAALADLRARRPPEGAAPPAEADGKANANDERAGDSGAVEPAAAPPPAGAQGNGPATLRVEGEARATLQERGAPRAIEVRPDGTFVFHYAAPDCATPPCPPGEDLAFGADGKRLPAAAP